MAFISLRKVKSIKTNIFVVNTFTQFKSYILSIIKNFDNSWFIIIEDTKDYYKMQIAERQQRLQHSFLVGDILNISYLSTHIIYGFEGLCLCLRKKLLLDPDASVLLRNRLEDIGIETFMAYYYKRIYKLIVADYKRKEFYYRKAKLYYLRLIFNNASTVKDY